MDVPYGRTMFYRPDLALVQETWRPQRKLQSHFPAVNKGLNYVIKHPPRLETAVKWFPTAELQLTTLKKENIPPKALLVLVMLELGRTCDVAMSAKKRFLTRQGWSRGHSDVTGSKTSGAFDKYRHMTHP